MKRMIAVLITLFTLILTGMPVLADSAYYQNAAYYQYNTPSYYDNNSSSGAYYSGYNNTQSYNPPNPVYYIDSNDKSTLYSLARYNSYNQPTCPLKQAKRHYYKVKKLKRAKAKSCFCKLHKKTVKHKKVKHAKKRVKKLPCRR